MGRFKFACVLAFFIASAHEASSTETVKKQVKSGMEVAITFSGTIDPVTCTTSKTYSMMPNVTRQPLHGSLTVRKTEKPFQSIAGRHVCNGKPYMSNGLYYTSNKGFRGTDFVEVTKSEFHNRMTFEKRIAYEIDLQ